MGVVSTGRPVGGFFGRRQRASTNYTNSLDCVITASPYCYIRGVTPRCLIPGASGLGDPKERHSFLETLANVRLSPRIGFSPWGRWPPFLTRLNAPRDSDELRAGTATKWRGVADGRSGDSLQNPRDGCLGLRCGGSPGDGLGRGPGWQRIKTAASRALCERGPDLRTSSVCRCWIAGNSC